ncbi:MAG: peptidoglycan-binding domain-containing protein [Calothrix sp. MO_167.B12]|nr:peptidoglycan-binding domain-containing protein [Calothrix sp. MO_167.B12]
MWCGLRKSSVHVVAACLVTTSMAIAAPANAEPELIYTQRQFCSVLRGLGYKATVSDTCLNDAATKKSIREFQKGYRLGVDGTAGAKTQAFAAVIVKILQANLNMALKLDPALPKNSFYGPKTADAVKKYQKKLELKETGIADLKLRQTLDREVKGMLQKPTTKPSPKPTATPTTKPITKPSPKPTATPTTKPTATPTTKPTATPTTTPTTKPTATPTTKPSPNPTATPTTTPTTKPSPNPTATP